VRLLPAALAAVVLLSCASLAGASGQRGAVDQLLETITISAGQKGVVTDTSFQGSEEYKLVFSGTTHTQCPSGSPNFGLITDNDAFYQYYAKHDYDSSPDTTPVRVIGAGFSPSQVPGYSSGHSYTIGFPANNHPIGRLTFGDTVPAGSCTHTGGFTIMVYMVESGTTKTVTGPAPGGSKFVDSPALPAALDCRRHPLPKGCGINLDDQPGGQDPRGTVIAAEGDLERSPTPGEFTFWCWLGYDFRNSAGDIVQLSAHSQLLFCVAMTRYLFARGKLGTPKPPAVRLSKEAPASAEAAGCRVKAIPISFRTRGRKAVMLRQARKAQLTSSSVRYSCSKTGGRTTIGITAPRGLRTALGTKLDLMVARAKNAPGKGPKLSITFGW
jgi:hypothetical protein